jgi:LacI family transcriptional regulator
VLLPDLTNPIFPPMVRGIEDALREARHTALLADTDNDEEREAEAVAALQERKVDGLLVATALRRHPLMERLAEAGVPMVVIFRVVENADVAAVVADDATGITEAFDHLRALGHQRIGHLAGPSIMSTGADRARAFEECARRDGLAELSPVVECELFSQVAGALGMERLLSRHPDVTAVIAGNDMIALGAIQTLGQVGKRCPDDVSIVGFNDMPFLDLMAPPLTSVHVSHYDLGLEAAHLLVEMLGRSRVSRRVVLPARLVLRRSTAPPANVR